MTGDARVDKRQWLSSSVIKGGVEPGTRAATTTVVLAKRGAPIEMLNQLNGLSTALGETLRN